MFPQVNEMLYGLETWLKSQDYNYIECNHVPEHLLGNNRKMNVLLRTFFRLCPYNLRNMKRPPNGLYPITPQSNVALLKAYAISNNSCKTNWIAQELLQDVIPDELIAEIFNEE